VPEAIQRRQIALFAKCDPGYGAGVARALNLEPADPLRGNSSTDAPKEANAA